MLWFWIALTFATPLYALALYFVSVKQVHARDCPIVLDLNGNGEIDVSGLTTANRHVYSFFFLPKFVEFDLRATGERTKIDWVLPNTDGFLLDMRQGPPSREIDGRWLFANVDHADGFEKLAELDANGDKKLQSKELKNLALWIDNGDGLFERSELRTLVQFGITEIPIKPTLVPGGYGGQKMIAYATSDQGGIYMEDVWFLSEQEMETTDMAISRFFRF